MHAHALEGVLESLELLVLDLRAKSLAARQRASRAAAAPEAAAELQLVLDVEAAALALERLLRDGASRTARLDAFALLAKAAIEFDAVHPLGGPLLGAEHGPRWQMTRSVHAHLLGEYSFGFLATEEGRAVRDEAQAVLNVSWQLHSRAEEWRRELPQLEAAVADEKEGHHG